MNKLLKGSIAGAAGIALLLGGAGTLASWNADASVGGGTIAAGNLTVTAGAAGTWTVTKSGGTAAPVTNIANFKIVPGDVLKYTSTANVVASGDNLTATLAITPGSITGTTSSTADAALAGLLTKSATLAATGTGVTPITPAPPTGTAQSFTVTAGAAGTTSVVTSVVTITFPKSTTAGAENAAKLGSVSLAGLTVSVTQD